jgi:hypothetical protein
MRKKWIWLAPLAILAILGFIVLGGVLVRGLWNWLLPPLFGWHQIDFWQALGLLVLCRILFGGLGRHQGGHSRFRRRMSDRMGDRIAERWEGMTPEERERFRERMRQLCGFGPASATGESSGG